MSCFRPLVEEDPEARISTVRVGIVLQTLVKMFKRTIKGVYLKNAQNLLLLIISHCYTAVHTACNLSPG